MNNIQSVVTVGSANSVMRAREAIDKGLLVCPTCLSSLEFNTGAGPFTSEKIKFSPPVKNDCYICEIRLLGVGYKVSRPSDYVSPN